jgi:hypothetical protein
MAGFPLDDRFLDVIVGFLALEAIALIAARILVGHNLSIVGALANCSAGACLLLALRAAIIGDASPAIALLLGTSLVAHLADLAARWTADSHSGAEAGRRLLSKKDRGRPSVSL